MEDYVQMTLEDWLTVKEQLKKDLDGVAESFVRIGYRLRMIDEQKLYEQDGYKSITEFAGEEYGLSASTVSRFMEINRRYSVDGRSEYLRPEFANLGSSKLAEMLALPDSDLSLVRPETTREDIREIKRFNRQQPAEGEQPEDLRELVKGFFEDKPEILEDLYRSRAFWEREAKGIAEIVNPSWSRAYRKGLNLLLMYRDKLTVKRYKGGTEDLTWEAFADLTYAIFGERPASQEEEPAPAAGPKEPVAPAQTEEEAKVPVPEPEEEKPAAEEPILPEKEEAPAPAAGPEGPKEPAAEEVITVEADILEMMPVEVTEEPEAAGPTAPATVTVSLEDLGMEPAEEPAPAAGAGDPEEPVAPAQTDHYSSRDVFDLLTQKRDYLKKLEKSETGVLNGVRRINIITVDALELLYRTMGGEENAR